MDNMKLGQGGRFKAIQKKIEEHEGKSKEAAAAIAASIGRNRYGAKKMSQMAAKGRARHAK